MLNIRFLQARYIYLESAFFLYLVNKLTCAYFPLRLSTSRCMYSVLGVDVFLSVLGTYVSLESFQVVCVECASSFVWNVCIVLLSTFCSTSVCAGRVQPGRTVCGSGHPRWVKCLVCGGSPWTSTLTWETEEQRNCLRPSEMMCALRVSGGATEQLVVMFWTGVQQSHFTIGATVYKAVTEWACMSRAGD